MKKTYGIIGLLLVVLGAGVFGGYRYLQTQVKPLNPEDAFSGQALFLMDIPNLGTWLTEDSELPIMAALQGTGIMRGLQQALSVWGMGSVAPLDSAALANQGSPNFPPLYVGAYLTGAGAYDLVLVIRDKEKAPKDQTASEKYEGIAIHSSPQGDKTWLEFHHRGLKVGSFNRVLIEDAIRQVLGRNKELDQPGLERVRELAGKSDEPTLFLNLPELSAYLGMFAKPEYATAMQGLSQFAGWLALDLRVQNSSLIFSGYAAPGPDDQLARYAASDTLAIQVEKVLPRNTSLLWRVGGAPEAMFRPDYLNAVAETGDPWLDFQGGEWAFALTEMLSDSPARASLFALKLSDPALAGTYLDSLSTADGLVGTTPLRHLTATEPLISLRFGRSLQAFDQAWFAIVDRYLLMGADRATLAQAVDQYQQNQTLSSDPTYRAYRERLLSSANAYLYISTPGLLPIVQNMTPDRVREAFTNGLESLESFQPLVLQFDRYRDLFLTSGFLDYGTIIRSNDQQLWALQLDTLLATAPVLVTDHRDGKQEMLMQDLRHQLYLVDRVGKVEWKRDLGAPILGSVHQIDYYKNGKLQYLFNTADKLFLVDRNGKDVADFPIALTAGAGVGVALFDYEGKRDYRIFVGGKQDNVYGYYQTGKPLPGWSPMKKTGPLSQPVLHAVKSDRDFLVLVNQSGEVQFKDRKGDNRFAAVSVGAPLLAPLVIDEGASDPYLIGVDTLGNLIRISFNGKLERLPLPRANSGSSFVVRNLDNTGPAELLIITGDQLIVRDMAGKERWSAKLPDSGPHVWAEGTGELVGIWSVQSGEWNLFNADGNLVSGFPMPGNGPFAVGPLSGAGDRILLGGDARVVAKRLE